MLNGYVFNWHDFYVALALSYGHSLNGKSHDTPLITSISHTRVIDINLIRDFFKTFLLKLWAHKQMNVPHQLNKHSLCKFYHFFRQ